MIAILYLFLGLIFFIPPIIITIDFISFIGSGESFVRRWLYLIAEFWAVVILPTFFCLLDLGDNKNTCCSNPLLSPQHRLSIFVLIGLCMFVCIQSSIRKKIAAPIIEVSINFFLIIGIILNVIIAIQIGDDAFSIMVGIVPIIMAFIMAFAKNQKLFLESNENGFPNYQNGWQKFFWKILTLKPILKIPILFIICLPLLFIIAAILLIFGQKPDSMIEAFTQTYKHGFSQLDYQCKDVVCGGHYLCTIAAKGHEKFVKPKRFGVRRGSKIIVNRQLLISNAFEELMEEKIPFIHKPIRKFYDVVGGDATRLYNVLGNKWVSDIVYILMKPLEWFFLFVLYLFDKKPENRIAQQYLHWEDRKNISYEQPNQ